MLLRRISKHIKDQNWQNKTTSLRGALATWHQTAGQPFCHAKRPEGEMAGAMKQSPYANVISKRNVFIAKVKSIQYSIQNYGKFMRLPQSYLPRNYEVIL